MDYSAVTDGTEEQPDTETVIMARTDAGIADIRRMIEKRLGQVRRDGPSKRTVDPDTGNIALLQGYSVPEASITVMHSDAPDSDEYRVEIVIRGDKGRVTELAQPIQESL
jgi:hypothetical protein